MENESRRTTEAIRAVLGEAAGKSPDEVRSMLVSELRSRGIDATSEAIETYRAVIARKLSAPAREAPFPAAPARRRHRGHFLLSASPARLIRSAKIMRSALPQYQPSRRVGFIEPDRTIAPLEVVLDPGARQWLASDKARLPRGADPASRIDVWLDFGDGPAGARPIRVNLRDHLIGRLRPEDGGVFEEAAESSRAAKETLMTSGFIRRGPGDDQLAFFVYRPLTGLT